MPCANLHFDLWNIFLVIYIRCHRKILPSLRPRGCTLISLSILSFSQFPRHLKNSCNARNQPSRSNINFQNNFLLLFIYLLKWDEFCPLASHYFLKGQTLVFKRSKIFTRIAHPPNSLSASSLCSTVNMNWSFCPRKTLCNQWLKEVFQNFCIRIHNITAMQMSLVLLICSFYLLKVFPLHPPLCFKTPFFENRMNHSRISAQQNQPSFWFFVIAYLRFYFCFYID